MSKDENMSIREILELNKEDLDNHFEVLGHGAGRIVYAINDDYVLKVAKNESGIKQCANEIYIYQSVEPKYKKYLCPILGYAPDRNLMLRANPFRKLPNRKHTSIFDVYDVSHPDRFEKDIEKLTYNYDLLHGDAFSATSWGLLGDKLVMIDYGCTNSVYDFYYRNRKKQRNRRNPLNYNNYLYPY